MKIVYENTTNILEKINKIISKQFINKYGRKIKEIHITSKERKLLSAQLINQWDRKTCLQCHVVCFDDTNYDSYYISTAPYFYWNGVWKHGDHIINIVINDLSVGL